MYDERHNKKEIKALIKIFLTPEKTKTHARPIYIEDAKKCGLNIVELTVKDILWRLLQELHIRTEDCLFSANAKLIESKDHHFYTFPPPIGEEEE